MRLNEPIEKLDSMFAHEGKCKYCDSVVKMWRNQKTLQLLPNCCSCILCGQRYYMEIENLREWEIEQWEQKNEPTHSKTN